MHALQRAGRSAPFLCLVLARKILHRVIGKRDARITALLRAPVNQPVLADVEITRARTAAPFVGLAIDQTFLKPVEARVVAVAQFLDLLENLFFSLVQRLKGSVMIVDDADGAGKAKLDGAARDDERIFGRLDAAADDGIDVDVKIRVLGQML